MWRPERKQSDNPCPSQAERHISAGATYRILCGRPHKMRAIRTSGLMSGRWKRNMVVDIRAPATERAGNRPSLHLHHRATSRLYTPRSA
jgi:hypothetical protein